MYAQPMHVRRTVATSLRRFALVAVLAGVAGAILPVDALHAASPDLITRSVDTAERAALPAHRAAWAVSQRDAGAVAADAALVNLGITLKRTPERQQAFDQFLREQKDPASPNYQHWLSPSEIGERFGASQSDIDAVSRWLRSQGLAVDGVANSRLRIRFSGSAGAVASAFGTELRTFQVGARTRMSNMSSAQVPRALAAAIASVDGLQTTRFEPLLRTRLAQPSSHAAATSCHGAVCDYAIFPADFAKIYDVDAVHQQGIVGSGQTIAVVGRARVYAPDMQNFQSLAGLPSSTPTVTIPTGGTDPGPPASTCSDTGTPSCSHPSDAVADQGEATLDVQRAGSVAPGATINLIVSNSTDDNSPDGVQLSTEYAIDHDPVPAKILSISYTSCEHDNGESVVDYLDGLFAQAEMEGISVFVASGDGGVAGCASLDATPTGTETASTNALCSSSHVTCVGGTEFADAAHPSAYWSSSTEADYLSALGYIPEGAWNDPLDSSDKPQFSATGGGVSAYIAKPSWQVGTGVPGSAGRYTPDVSFAASPREGYFTCLAAQGGGCAVSGGSFSFLPTGGTSASAPSMAGIAALLNQKTGSAQANLNPRLYALAANTTNGVFHDASVASVTGVNSGVASCSLSVPSICNNSTPGTTGLGGGLQGYAIGTGYDLATGLGSLDVANLLAQWGAAAAGVNLDQYGLTGAWSIDGASSQGLSISILPDYFGVGSGQLFTGWFTYDVTAAGGQRWYTLQGPVSASAPSATIPIYTTQGGSFDSSRGTTTTAVGSATLQLSDCDHGTLDFRFSSGTPAAGSLALSRTFPNVNCTPQGSTSTTATDYL
ncbi:MAG: S53 family peptidase, partial [Dokdonella sp.]